MSTSPRHACRRDRRGWFQQEFTGSQNLTSSEVTLALGTSRNWTNIFWILIPIAGIIVLVIDLSQPGVGHAAETQPAQPE